MKLKLVLTCLFLVTWFAVTSSAQSGSTVSGDSISDAIYLSGLKNLKSRISLPEGLVIKISKEIVYITNDSGLELDKGTQLKIVRSGEAIVHPVTGEKLGFITETIGKVEVVSSSGKLISAAVKSGKGKIKPGDKIGVAESGEPKVAFIPFFSRSLLDDARITKELYEKLAKWPNLSWISQYTVERLLYDENISKAASLVDEKVLTNLREKNGADYLIILEVTERSGAILTDVALYNLKAGAPPIYTDKGLVSNADRSATAAPVKRPEKIPASVIASPPKERKPSLRISPPAKRPPKTSPEPVETVVEAPFIFQEPETKIKTVKKKIVRSRKPFKGLKAWTLIKFDKSISAMLTHDLDNDGADELVIGFLDNISVHKRYEDGQIKYVWDKALDRGSMITGIHAGDFNGNGKPEVYVNNVVSSTRVESLVFELDGDSFRVIMEKQNILFYTDADGKLYGQSQDKEGRLSGSIDELVWAGSGFKKKHFINLPNRTQLGGLGFFDLDGDGVTDISGYGKDRQFTYYSSASRKWVTIKGKFGGSNKVLRLQADGKLISKKSGNASYRKDILSPVLFFNSSNGKKYIYAIRNWTLSFFGSNPKYIKGYIVTLENNGGSYVKKGESPLIDGVINSALFFDNNSSNLLLIARNYFSFRGRQSSELILINLD